MKKRILSIFVCVLLIFGLTSCMSKKPSTPDQNVNNNVTNNITNEIVNVGDISLETIEEVLETTIKKVENSVIGIACKQVNFITDQLGHRITHDDTESVGSGVIYKREEVKNDAGELINYNYYAYTNNHVVTGLHEDEGKEYHIYAYMGYEDVELPAEVLGKDPKQDLAVIKFQYSKYIEPVELADVSTLKKGNFVVAIGNPEGFDYFGSASFGIISNLNRYLSFDTDNDRVKDFTSRFIQTDTAINPGNSGGGLFTLDGKLVGINSVKLASKDIDNMGFAIPVDIVKAETEYLEAGKSIDRPRLGVTCISVRDLTVETMLKLGIYELPNIYNGENPYGILVTDLAERGSLVGTAIGKNDILLEAEGIKLTNNNILTSLLNSLTEFKVGDIINLKYYDCSEGAVKELKVKLTTAE